MDSQARYEHDDPHDLTTAIIYAIADAEGDEPTEIKSPPLYDYIDAPAVEEALFGSRRKRNTDAGRQSINFFYRGHDITVRSDGWVFVDSQSG